MLGDHWSESRCLAAILAIALAVRLVCAFGVQWQLDRTTREVCLIAGDAAGYWELAGKLTAGEPYAIYDPPRRVMRMPGFPWLLAIPRALCGNQLLPARIWLAVIGTVGCWLTYWLGSELHSRAAGLWAAAVIAVSPVHALFSVLILSETAFATALTASLVAVVSLQRRLQQTEMRGITWRAFGTGLLFAAATSLRPTWLLTGPAAALCLVASGGPLPRRLAAAAILCLGLYGALLPWGLRNQAVTGHFTLTTFWVGPSLYDGLNPQATGDSNMTFFDDENLLGKMTEYEMDQEYRRRAWEFAASHPQRACELMGIKLVRYWSLWPNAEQFKVLWQQVLVAGSFAMILVPALAASWYSRRNWRLLIVTWGPILYFAAIHLLFVGSIRYRLPAELPFAVLSGIGWHAWVSRWRTGPTSPDRGGPPAKFHTDTP